MSRTQRQQGFSFERVASKNLREMKERGELKMVHKFVNATGTPADFLVAAPRHTYLVECKSLKENRQNKAASFRLSALTANEWSGMGAWQGGGRKSFVLLRLQMLDGSVYCYAIPFHMVNAARINGIKTMILDQRTCFVVPISGDHLDLSGVFAAMERY